MIHYAKDSLQFLWNLFNGCKFSVSDDLRLIEIVNNKQFYHIY